MSVSLAHEVRAVGTPVYCSACFNQNPQALHVDMDAACDRGYGDRDDGHKIAMDDLILCEACIKAAALLVGYGDLEELRRENENLRKRHRQELARGDRLEAYLGKMEDAFSTRPELIVAPRKVGRPPRESF